MALVAELPLGEDEGLGLEKNARSPLSVPQRLLQGFAEAAFRALSHLEAIHEHHRLASDERFRRELRDRARGRDEPAEARLRELESDLLGRKPAEIERKGDEDELCLPLSLDREFSRDRGRVVAFDSLPASAAEELPHFGEEDLHVVVDLGHRAHGRSRVLDRMGLVDGDGGRNPVDLLDQWLVHAIQELPGVGGEAFDVPPLSLGVEGVEGERGFSRAGDSGDGDQASERDVDVEVLEVVLAGAADANELAGAAGFGRHLSTPP